MGEKIPKWFFSIQDSLIPFWSCWHDIDHFCSGGNRKKAASGFHRGNGHNPYHPYPHPHHHDHHHSHKLSSSPLSRWQLTDFVMTIVPTSFFQVFNSPHWYTIQLSPIWSTYFQFGKALICWKSNTRWQTKTKTTASASIWSGAIWWRLGTGSNHYKKSFLSSSCVVFRVYQHFWQIFLVRLICETEPWWLNKSFYVLFTCLFLSSLYRVPINIYPELTSTSKNTGSLYILKN